MSEEEVYEIGKEVKQVLEALVRSENAMSLVEFVDATQLPLGIVSQCLDLLVALRVLQSDYSLHQHEIGEIVYMFADNNSAQAVYHGFVQEG